MSLQEVTPCHLMLCCIDAMPCLCLSYCVGHCHRPLLRSLSEGCQHTSVFLTRLHKSGAEFDGERVVERHLQRLGGTDMLHHQMRSAFMTGRPETLDLFLHQYGDSPALRTLLHV